MIPPTGTPHFEQTTSESEVESLMLEMIDGKVDSEGSLDASVSITASGYPAVLLGQSFLAADDSALSAAVRTVIKGVSGFISDVKVTGSAVAESFVLSFNVHTPIFVRNSGKTAELTLPMSDFSLVDTGYVGQNQAYVGNSKFVRIGLAGKYTYRIKLEFDPTLTLEGLSPLSLERPFGTYKASYLVHGNLLVAERRLTLRTDEVPNDIKEDYMVFREKVSAETTTRLRLVSK